MNTPSNKIPRSYAAPSYVSAFRIASLLCLVAAVAFILVAIKEGEIPWTAIGWLMAAAVNLLYAQLADAVGRTAWQTALTAQDLAPALAQLASLRLQTAAHGNGTTPASREIAVPITDPADFQRTLETAEHYFIAINGRERGPFSVQQIREMYAKGAVDLSLPTRMDDGEPGPTVGKLIELE